MVSRATRVLVLMAAAVLAGCDATPPPSPPADAAGRDADALVEDAPDGDADHADAGPPEDGPPPAPGSPEAMLRELCAGRPRTGPTTTLAYSTGAPRGVLRGAEAEDLEAIRLTLTEPFRLRRLRLNLRGAEGGRVRVRLTGDVGRTIPDVDRDLMAPVDLDVTEQGWRELAVEPPIDLHPAHHAWIVVEHLSEPVGLLVAAKADADGQQGRSRARFATIVNDPTMNPQGDPWLGLGPMVEYMTEAIGERICPRVGEARFVDRSDALGPASPAGRPQWIDVDGDGWEDLAAYRDGRTPMGRLALWRGRPGFAFEDRTAALGLDGATISTGSWADLDADGDLDLYGADYQDGFGPFPPARGSRVFLQGSGGSFTAVDAALEGPGPTNASAFGDCDGDGELDLFVGQWLRMYPVSPGTIGLFRGRGGGRFEDITGPAGLPVPTGMLPRGRAPAFSAMWADYDNDGDSDLFVQTYLGAPNWAYVNDGSCRFTDMGRANGFAGTPPVFGTSFGIDFGDYDNDGDLDAFDANIAHARGDVVGIDRSRLLRNSGAPDYRFENVTVDGGVLHTEGDHEGLFGDWDNDGDLDLLVSVGPAYGYQWTRLYRQEPDHRFTDVTYLTGFPNLWSTGAAFHDVDRDGDLDIALASARLTLLRNELPAGAHWIELRLRDPAGRNRDAIGARVTVVSAGGVRRMREVTAGSGFLAGQAPLLQHVGLGGEAAPVTVEVRWPGRASPAQVTRYESLAPDRAYLVERGSAPRELPR